MLQTIKKWINDLLTEDDGSTICYARVASAVALLSFIGYSFYDFVFVNHIFHYNDYANGLMQILGGSAAVIGAKQITSKSPPPQDPSQ